MSELIHRTVAVLEVLRGSDEPLSIRQIAAQADLSKSTVQRLLRELLATHLVGLDRATQRYQLGPRMLAFGMAYQKRLDVGRIALAHMNKLRDAIDETVGLSVGYGEQLIHIQQVASQSELRAVFDIGRPLPLWSGAPSRLFLGEHSEDEIRRIVSAREQADVEPNNPPSADELLADVQTSRERGFAIAVEETLHGVSTLSAPVRDSAGALAATLSVTLPTTRLTQERIADLLPRVVATADAVSAELGWLQPPRRIAVDSIPQLTYLQ